MLTYPSGEVDDVGRLVFFEDGLGGIHVPQVTVLAAEEYVLLVLLGLRTRTRGSRSYKFYTSPIREL